MVSLTSRPLLLGHRGVRTVRRFSVHGLQPKLPAENTFAAFEYALACGCDGFEFDVRFTRDRRAVLCHDPQIDGKDVATTDYSDLRRADNELACLEDVLAHFGNLAYLDIELKVGGDEEAIVAALRSSLPKRGYVLSSFLPDVLLRIHEIDADVPLGYICDHRRDAERWTEFMKPLAFGRAAKPEEIAWMVAFLASERSGYTTGSIVTIDGGGSSRRSAF